MKSFRQDFDRNSKGKIGIDFSFAFQPIVDAKKKEINSFEALIRGPRGEPAASVLSQVIHEDISAFDDVCRQRIIELASRLNVSGSININLFTTALYQVDLNITGTFKASLKSGFPVEKIIFEVTESENLTDHSVLLRNLKLLRDFGFRTAIDDFGMGHSGLKLLMEYQPNYIKLDRNLISNIQKHRVKQIVFGGVQHMCEKLSIDIVAEGIENEEEYTWLDKAGVALFQGFYFARPAFEALPGVSPRGFSLGGAIGN